MEIEARIKVNDFAEIIDKILKMGAVLKKKCTQKDVYYGETGLYNKLGYSFMFRIRKEAGKTFFTYKGAKLKIDGVWEEYETEIADSGAVINMLEAAGFEKIIETQKLREEYKLKNYSICLDAIDSLGNFVEIEQISDDTSRKGIYDLIGRLGLGQNDVIDKGYVTMLLAQSKSPYLKYINN
jgi:adenylate cyclase class 2